jgi:NAD(P)-dependent dehydrogenase (short-subunit alcohol dehydrogenase family)
MSPAEVVLITGANTGLGYETIKALLQSPKPYHVLMGSRDVAKGEAAVKSLQEEVPKTLSKVDVVQIDVSDDDLIDNAMKHIKEKFGRLDVLVNNAGK